MSPTYRYGVVIFGASYAPGYADNPEHVFMAESIEDARTRLWLAARGNPRAEDGNGNKTSDTPAYGDHHDGAWLYRVDRSNPQFGEVLDEPGDRARHAYAWMEKDEPSYLLEFGPVWGYSPSVTKL